MPDTDTATKTICERQTRAVAIDTANACLAGARAEDRIEWALARLPGRHVMTSSFGAQAAVTLKLVNSVSPGIPVILIDTGYLFPETYRFIDELCERMRLNLKVYRGKLSPAWQEARHGRRWENGVHSIEAYNRDNKVEPMERALEELAVGTWFAGLRRGQSASREGVPVLASSGERWKMHPIIDWNDRDVYNYLSSHDLPYHPLWDQGYVSIGDVHTTRSLNDVDNVEATRFFGLKRECGIHEMDFGNTGTRPA